MDTSVKGCVRHNSCAMCINGAANSDRPHLFGCVCWPGCLLVWGRGGGGCLFGCLFCFLFVRPFARLFVCVFACLVLISFFLNRGKGKRNFARRDPPVAEFLLRMTRTKCLDLGREEDDFVLLSYF